MKKTIILLLTILIYSCNDSMKFDSEKWKPIESGLYGENYRKKMVFDLVNNVLVFENSPNKNGMKYSEVERLIYKPYRIDSISSNLQNYTCYYEISERIDYGIDPNGGMNLELIFSKDSILIDWTINEYWNRP